MCKEIENISQRTRLTSIKFRVRAPGTNHGGKFTILHIEDLRPAAARGGNAVRFKFTAVTFGAFPLIRHFYSLTLIRDRNLPSYY